MIPSNTRVLMSAYQCGPGMGSVSQIGWEWYSRMSERAQVTLVTHVRNRAALEAAGAPLPGSEIIYIDTEWFARRLYGVSKRLFPSSEHSVFLLSSLDFFVYENEALKLLKPRVSEWDVVHAVTPVSPSAHSRLGSLGLPFVRGPLNGGLRTPKGFDEFMRADSAWFYPVRELSKPVRKAFHAGGSQTVTLVANDATEDALTGAEKASLVRMPEIAVEPSIYQHQPWPDAPSVAQPLRVLFVGRLVPAKALPLLFAAIHRVQQEQAVELTVAGDGPMREDWQRLATGLDLNVRFLGACDASRVAEEMARCHVFCLPSVRESGGAVLLEAMSAGRPVIAVNYGGPATLVNESVGRLVSARDSRSVVQGIEQALEDVIVQPAVWRAKGLAGRKHVMALHTWNARIQKAINIYASLTGAYEKAAA